MHERSAAALGSVDVPKRNYGYEKRQKELKRERKREEKRQRKRDRTGAAPAEAQPGETPGVSAVEPDRL